jgi:uncharacterized protein YfdQ (DUF2303 family)
MMNNINEEKNNASSIIEAMKTYHRPWTQKIGDEEGINTTVLFTPKGMCQFDIQAELDKRAPAPRRAFGEVKANTLAAFVALVARHSSPKTVIYVDDGPQPKLVAVLNDHAAGADPNWRDHRVVYTPTLSDEWKAWAANEGKPLAQTAFAELLEDRCLDVIAPSSAGPSTQGIITQLGVKAAQPAELQGLARGLSIKVDQHVKEVRRLDSGEAQVIFAEQHTGDDGKPLSVPNAFVIAVPVFVGGAAYTHVVRLRYRASGGRITWSYNVVHADQAKRDAVLDMRGVCEKLPEVLVVEGTP